MNKIRGWLTDYLYLLRGHSYSFKYRNPPRHYLEHIVKNKKPVILIQGIHEKWSFLSKIGNRVSLLGHPVYIIPDLGQNLMDIPTTAKIVKELIDKKKLQNTVIIAHSKGGLVGKYLLSHLNKEHKIKKLIAIVTPFSGVKPAKYIPLKHFQELSEGGKNLIELQLRKDVNKNIISIYPSFDNHVWPQKSSYLKGATNIKISVHGHHKILFNEELIDKIIKILED